MTEQYNTAIATNEGIELREDLVTESGALSWDSAMNRCAAYRESAKAERSILADEDRPSSLLAYTDENESNDVERVRQVNDSFRTNTSVIQTHELILGGLPFDADSGEWMPALDYFAALNESWPVIRQKLYHLCEGNDWWYAFIRNPTDAGYPENHLLLQVKSMRPLSQDNLSELLDIHVSESQVATSDATHLDRHARTARSVDLGSVVEAMPNFRNEVKEEAYHHGRDSCDTEVSDESRLAFTTCLWASAEPRFTFSKSAQEHISVDNAVYNPPMTSL